MSTQTQLTDVQRTIQDIRESTETNRDRLNNIEEIRANATGQDPTPPRKKPKNLPEVDDDMMMTTEITPQPPEGLEPSNNEETHG